jgi:hypothetical protein
MGLMPKKLIAPLHADQSFYEQCLPNVVEFYRYWLSRTGERSMPRRQDIDPVDFPRHLLGILLIDVISERDETEHLKTFQYRVVGTREVDNRKHNPTGRLVEDGFFAENLENALLAYQSVRTHKQPIYERLRFVTEDGLRVDEHSIVLPISEDGERVSQIIVYSEQIESGQDQL